MVKIIDVRYNKEQAKEVLERSEKLRGYSLLLNYIKQYKAEGYSLEEAIDMAVKRCIEENVLKDFLTKNGKEVRGMIYEDITLERFLEIRGEEKFEEGRVEGHVEGRAEGEISMQERINKLNQSLLADKRYEELEKSTKDKAYQEQLFQEYGL